MPQAVNIGTNTGSTGATLAVTVGAAGVPAGSLIVVGVTEKSTTGVNGSIADTATNTWNTSQSGNLAATAADGRGMVFFAFNSKALVNGNTITYTRNTSGSICAISASYWGPDVVVAANPEDTAARASATGTTGTITVTSGSPAHPNNLFVAVLCDSGTSAAGGNATFTQAASPWATPPNEANSGGSGNARVNGGWNLGSGTATLTYNPSYSQTAQQWALFITAFQLDLEPPTHWQPKNFGRPPDPPVTYARFRYNQQGGDPAIDRENPHFLGRHRPLEHRILPAYRQNTGFDAVETFISTSVVGFDDGYLSPRSIAPLYQRPSTDGVIVAQPETQPHFIGRYTAPVHARFNYQSGAGAGDVPTPDANANWMVVLDRPQHARIQATRLYYQSPATDVPTVAAQPETNISFLGRFAAPTHAVLPAHRQNAALDLQPETNPHFIGRFAATAHAILPALRQNIPPAFAVETNPHFVGRYTAPIHARFPYSSLDVGVPQVETNVSFVGRYAAPLHTILPVLRQNAALDVPPQPETQPHFVGRFAPTAHAIMPALRQNLPPAFAAETNPHFVGRFTAPKHAILPALRQISDPNVPPVVVVETNVSFIGRYQAPTHARFNYNTTWDSRVPQAETNVSFIGRFSATPHIILPALRQAPAMDVQRETNPNPHFIGRFTPTVHSIPPIARQNAATDFVVAVAQPETNVSFLGRFTAPVHARFAYNFAPEDPSTSTDSVSTIVITFDDGYLAPQQIAPLFQQPAGDLPALGVQPETNPHFLGTFEAYTHSLLMGARQGGADALPVVETNPHFIGRFTATAHTLPPTLRQNQASEAATAIVLPEQHSSTFVVAFEDGYLSAARISATYWQGATDFITAAPIPETQPHFLGRFTPTTHQINILARQNAAAVFAVETNPHFIGRYTAPVHARFSYNTVWDSRVPQPETNQHFIGRYSPATHAINVLARQNAAIDTPPTPPQAETNVHFLGRYRAPVHARFAYNTWDTAVRQVETNPHTIGRFTPAKITVLPALRQVAALDLPAEQNPHFLGRHTPASHRINQTARQNAALDTQRPEQNPHFIGRHTAPTHNVLRALLGNLGGATIAIPNVEATPHFIGRYAPMVHARSIYHLERQGVTLVQVAEAKSILSAFIASTALSAETATSTLAAQRAASTLDRNR